LRFSTHPSLTFLPRQYSNFLGVFQQTARYPGGKTWLIPFFHSWAKGQQNKLIVEPFAGGASIALSCLEANICQKALLIELDPNIAAVWKTILGREWKRFTEKIKTFNPTIASLERELVVTAVSTFERAWQTILLNRINHGGITAVGSGRLRRGEGDKGIGSRWYPETLIRRIERIRALRKRIEFIQGDGLRFLKDGGEARSVYFIDPPYPIAGRRLYDYWNVDHSGLFTATGEDWEEKAFALHPDKWREKWLTEPFLPHPLQAFFVPHFVPEQDWKNTIIDGGLLFDRFRIAATAREKISQDLGQRIAAWNQTAITGARQALEIGN
jgi:DNA adenine methylase